MIMKKILFFSFILFCVSCTNESFEMSNSCQQNEMLIKSEKFHINESEAIDIANRFFRNTTRSKSLDFKVECVKNKKVESTRSNVYSHDTLAYILNRGDNDGFIIISSDNRIFPILAFSESGTFKYKEDYNDVVYANFISRLDERLRSVENSDSIVQVPEGFPVGCMKSYPKVSYTWTQTSPFNNCVVKDHPNCLAGCVAIAMAQAMVHCKDTLVYKKQESGEPVDKTYNLKMIREALADPDSIPVTYDSAMDEAAELVYQIGHDVKMNYGTTLSGTDYKLMTPLFKGLEFIVREPDFTEYTENSRDIANSLLNDDIICVVGKGGPSGDRNNHAWIIDGCEFCWAENRPPYHNVTNLFLHCNWGWGGDCNGYYSGYYFMTDVEIYYTSYMLYLTIGKNAVVKSYFDIF